MTTTKRFRFTSLHAYAGHADRRYRVTRITDGKDLGAVSRHYYGAGRPYWQIKSDNESLNGRQYDTRAEAAEALDAGNLATEICACGKPVPEHDHPTRVAIRAYAASTAELWHHRSNEAEQAFRNAIPRDRAYSFDRAREAGTHAHMYAHPHADGDVRMVQMLNDGTVLSVDLHISSIDDSVSALYWANGRRAGFESFGNHLADPAAVLAQQIPDFEARGYVRAYDWSL